MSETKANLHTQSRNNRIVSVYSWSHKISKLRDRVVFIWKLLGWIYVLPNILRARHGWERLVPQGKQFFFLQYVMKIPFIRKYLLTTIRGYDTISCSLLSTYTVFLVDLFFRLCLSLSVTLPIYPHILCLLLCEPLNCMSAVSCTGWISVNVCRFIFKIRPRHSSLNISYILIWWLFYWMYLLFNISSYVC